MSTRQSRRTTKGIFKPTGNGDEYMIPENFELPNCTIEDVDRALFELFDKQLPFTYKHKEGTRRTPVIFASGERFAVLRRKKPLRDRSGTLILPLVSIMRTGITQSPSMGAGTSQGQRITIKQRIAESDAEYQRIINRASLINSEDAAIKSNKAVVVSGQGNENKNIDKDEDKRDSRQLMTRAELSDSGTKDLKAKLGNNIFEVITMAPPKYYTASYEITFWTQYTTQMNDMIMSMMTLYQSFSHRTFRLETPKGYWFVAYVDEDLNPGNNFDDFTDNERLIRYSFTLKIPAYIIGNTVPGGASTLRRYFSAPILSFGIEAANSIRKAPPGYGVPSGKAKDYILDDFRAIEDSLPGQFIASANETNTGIKDVKSAVTGSDMIGGKEV